MADLARPIPSAFPASSAGKVDVDAEKAAITADIQKIEFDAKLLSGLTPAQRDLFEYYKYRIGTCAMTHVVLLLLRCFEMLT